MDIRKALLGGGLTAAALFGGAAGAALVNGTAGAATTSTAATPAAAAPAAPAAPDGTARPSFPAHGTPEHEALEKPVTGDNATKAKDAAVKAAGSGTAGDVVTDAKGDGYEVVVTKADGTTVEIHLDSSFNAMQGGHGGHGGGRPNDNDADDAPASTAPSTTVG